ncbi:MAG: UDP-N-acetylglucosamine 2-epimerase (hydrolyzing) [Bacteroidales bacterium]|nr:UDP-N-acetylglucosamine 2-epimerase (hydrolyzing) [Bacteroidales bacterium]MBD5208636.1 UDP-N-acetylglucosamine 2-epimerase (hydrolyzing) [Bacteroidales bacterium]
MKRIAIATTTRADWGLLLPLASSLRSAGVETIVMASNMHLMEQFGMTVNEIIADGFTPEVKIPVSGTPAEIAAQTIEGFAKAFQTVRPDAVVLLGDRFEIAAVALAASITGIPIIHIAGGTISEGAIDDSLRHAVTKLASLHLAETELSAARIIQMGEQPDSVFVCGATGVYNILNIPLLSREELEQSLNFKLPKRVVTGTLHAATRDTLSPLSQMKAFCSALDRLFKSTPDTGAILTYPNNDVDPQPQIEVMLALKENHPDRVFITPSLGLRRYLSAAALSSAVVGNSSSGIVEIPSLKVPVLNIGCRQQGRECSEAVIHCGSSEDEIFSGLTEALSENARKRAGALPNPYYRPDTTEVMTNAILNYNFRPFPSKKFHSL